MRKIYFVSQNQFKLEEIVPFWEDGGVRIEHYKHEIRELQIEDFEQIVIDKVRKAFEIVRQPILVDHSGIELEALGGFPGGMTKSFWDAAGEKICELVSLLGNDKAHAIVCLGYTDGKTINVVKSIKSGSISKDIRGGRDFGWDRIFIPDGMDKTFSELSIKEKNDISPRADAFREIMKRIIV